MATISVTASQVLLISGPTADGIAGATITAGQGLYLDTSTNTWKLAQEDGTLAESGSGGFGIALNGASAGQTLKVALPGAVVNLGAGAAVAVGKVLIVSGTAGSLDDVLITTQGHFQTVAAIGGPVVNYVKVIGVPAGAANA